MVGFSSLSHCCPCVLQLYDLLNINGADGETRTLTPLGART